MICDSYISGILFILIAITSCSFELFAMTVVGLNAPVVEVITNFRITRKENSFQKNVL